MTDDAETQKLIEAVMAWPQLDGLHDVSANDLLDWFVEWRNETMQMLAESGHAETVVCLKLAGAMKAVLKRYGLDDGVAVRARDLLDRFDRDGAEGLADEMAASLREVTNEAEGWPVPRRASGSEAMILVAEALQTAANYGYGAESPAPTH